ncbi:MAG: efflux RND transporter periplasmic adaptor subunit [Alphaproteobacteria bacterium]|nr:efflux RND transporter periplasmic adaptor subunit [Alphaproteobacteria bacterium]MBV9061500.1 efflux RND transporter periplasmic adaptor subunit [Alphaproteobacteria bacterium]
MNERSKLANTGPAARVGIGAGTGGFSRRSWVLLALAAAAILVLTAVLLRKGSAPAYMTQTVTRGRLVVTVSATGTLQPRDQVDVGAEISGRIDALYADYNDHVKKGQKLAKINTEQIEAQLAQSRAALEQAKATYDQSSHNYPRTEALAKSNAASKQDLDNARADLLRAKANVNLAAAQVRANETLLSKATIYSPMDGVVLDRKVSRGQTVVAAMQTPVLFTLASDLSQMELDVDIDEADVGQVHSGQHATFTVDAYPGRQFDAKLVSIHSAPKVMRGAVTYRGVLLVSNPRGLLKPGMSATANIVASTLANALLVPNMALRFVPALGVANAPPAANAAGHGRVWTLENGRLRPHDLTLGATNRHLTQVVSGDLATGEQVVTDVKAPQGKE